MYPLYLEELAPIFFTLCFGAWIAEEVNALFLAFLMVSLLLRSIFGASYSDIITVDEKQLKHGVVCALTDAPPYMDVMSLGMLELGTRHNSLSETTSEYSRWW